MNFDLGQEGILTLRGLMAGVTLASLAALMSCSAEVREPRHEIKGSWYGEDFVYRETPLALRIESTSRGVPSPDYGWGGGYFTRYNYNYRWNRMDGWWDSDLRSYVVGPGPYR
jgi:hypothetical protein